MNTEEQTYRDFVKEKLTSIETQTMKTNGRVTAIEERQVVIRTNIAFVKGGIAVIGAVLLPVLFIILQHFI